MRPFNCPTAVPVLGPPGEWTVGAALTQNGWKTSDRAACLAALQTCSHDQLQAGVTPLPDDQLIEPRVDSVMSDETVTLPRRQTKYYV